MKIDYKVGDKVRSRFNPIGKAGEVRGITAGKVCVFWGTPQTMMDLENLIPETGEPEEANPEA